MGLIKLLARANLELSLNGWGPGFHSRQILMENMPQFFFPVQNAQTKALCLLKTIAW